MASWLRRSGLSRPFNIQSSRILKRFGIFVLASLRPSTLKKGSPEVGSREGIFRSSRSILDVHGPHEVRFVPPFTRYGLAGRSF